MIAGACMLVLLSCSLASGICTQVKPPQDMYPVRGQGETVAAEFRAMPTPDPVAGIKTVKFVGMCLDPPDLPPGSTTAPEPATVEAAPVPEPKQAPEPPREAPKPAKGKWW